MSDDDTLHARARALVESGALLGRRPNQVWAGIGSGQHRCLMCGAPILAEQTAFEVDFTTAEGSTSEHFHVPCFWAVEAQWRRLGVAVETRNMTRR